MTDETTNVLGYIVDIRHALDGVVELSDQITPEGKTELCRLSNLLDALVRKITEKEK